MDSTSFIITVLILSVTGLISSKYNTKMARGKKIEIHSMVFLDVGFISVILFSIGAFVFAWPIAGLMYLLIFSLCTTVSYVVGLSVKHYYDAKEKELVHTRNDAFNKTLKENGYVTDLGVDE